jgi:Lrp/AsnC family transcriptional regulator, leucine-responsive regulatory protein
MRLEGDYPFDLFVVIRASSRTDAVMVLDLLNRKIVAELQRAARLSYTELGARVGLSAPAVAARVRALERAGVIRGYHAQVDPAALGWPVEAFMTVTVGGRSEGLQVGTIAVAEPLVLECHRLTGRDDFLLRLVSSSIGDLEPLIDRLNRHGQPVTSVVLSSPKRWAAVPDPHAGSDSADR